MRAVIQRVIRAKVTIPEEGDRVTGEIGRGFLVLLGVAADDSLEEVRLFARKICQMRVFDDADGKMNLDVRQIGGSLLVVSQFTLFADCVRGNRPGFTKAAPPEVANRLYEEFIAEARRTYGIRVETGVFWAMMAVELVNDGPVTIELDSDELLRKKGA